MGEKSAFDMKKRRTISITAIVIAKNEENNIAECIRTLKFADETLVVDSGSTDRTTNIAQKNGARVVRYLSGKNFSDWRNKGLNLAQGEWVLYVDADERVTRELKDEIVSIVSGGESDIVAYAIPRRNFILGKELKHGGFYPDYQKRFFYRKHLLKWQGDVHEEPVFEGEMGKAVNPLVHRKQESLSDMVNKTNSWSEIEARLMYEAQHPKMNVPRFITAMFREFWYRMIAKRAFLDGKIGIIFAIYQVFSKFTSYAKLWELQINETK